MARRFPLRRFLPRYAKGPVDEAVRTLPKLPLKERQERAFRISFRRARRGEPGYSKDKVDRHFDRMWGADR